jgi:hypothetical protein
MNDPVAVVRRHGVLLESAKGPIPNLAELVVGGPIRGSWWAHPGSHEIFAVINRARESRAVVATRLVNGKVTLIHRRLWPALARLADQLPAGGLDALHEEHTATGAHRLTVEPFPDWVPPNVLRAAEAMSEADARAALPSGVDRALSGQGGHGHDEAEHQR